MKPNKTQLHTLATIMVITALLGSPLLANYKVTCASQDHSHTRCRLDRAGYVSLVHQQSKASCIQGRTWDWDHREIWVDDGCRAEFEVEIYDENRQTDERHRSDDSHDAKVAAGVLVGAAILGALVHNANHDDKDKYRDDNYHGGQHTSYIPGWMVGTFKGHNPMYGTDVVMTIRDDGRVTADADGQAIRGYVNDDILHVGNVLFDIDRNREGFVTSQRGDRHNEVHYRRID